MDAPSDRIFLEGLEFTGHHGWFEEERQRGCRFRVDARLYFDLRPAAASDRLRDTIDYGAVAATLVRVGTGASVHLLENLATQLADAVLAEFPASGVRIKLSKLQPQVEGAPAAVGVTVERMRG